MNGLIIQDLGGGDAAISLVDSDLWAQIIDLNNIKLFDMAKFTDYVACLLCDDPDVEWTNGCPERKGKIVNTWYTQTFCIESVSINNVIGILTLP